MSQQKQIKFRVLVKGRLAELDRTIQDVATEIGYPRTTVSQCINHNRFPKVRKKVEDALAL